MTRANNQLFLVFEPIMNAVNAPVAQLDRALPSEGKGRTFESSRVRQHPQRCPSTAIPRNGGRSL
jgi:hypothetical protein